MARISQPFLNRTRGVSATGGDQDNPLDHIAEDHMHEREVCALIDRLVSGAGITAPDLTQVLDFLAEGLQRHLEDEEIDLFPMMLRRCAPEEEIGKIIAKLRSDHGHGLAQASEIAALIGAAGPAGAGLNDQSRKRLTEFVRHARRHLILENAVVLPIARARLTARDLKTMKRHMIERRGRAARKEDKPC